MTEQLDAKLEKHIAAQDEKLEAISAQLTALHELTSQYPMSPKAHYDQHSELAQMLTAYKEATGMVRKVLLAAAIFGVLMIAAVTEVWKRFS